MGGSPLWTGVVAILAAVATSNVLLWLMAIAESPPSVALIAPAALAVAAVTGHVVWRRQGGELSWTGEWWQWHDRTGQLRVALDLDRWMLLRFDPHAGRQRWIALEQRRVRGPWAGLRAALYAPRSPEGRNAAPPA